MLFSKICIIILAIGLHSVLFVECNTCVINVNSKHITGRDRQISDGRTVCEYTNIPYAAKMLRFERAALKPISKISKKKFQYTPKKCIQGSSQSYTGQEQCLILNIYQLWTGNRSDHHLHPVLVYVHGGTFNMGSPQEDIKDVDDFLKESIIFVTMNYRLGLFGFSSFPNGSIDANIGLADQQVALEWIHNFIHYFQGDAKQVTLFGWSAGAASVSYHLYMKASQNLFQRAIIVSGSLVNPWAFNPQGERCSLLLCKKLNISNCTKLVLGKLESHELLPPFSIDLYFYHFGIMYPCFLPTFASDLNKFINAPNILIEEKPINDVPILMGYTSLEDICDVDPARAFSMKDYVFPYSNVNVSRFFKNMLKAFMKNHSIDDIADLRRIGDMHYGIWKLAEKYSLSARSPLYLYRFALDLSNRPYCGFNEKGAMHGDDMKLLFDGKIYSPSKSKLSNIRSNLIGLWIQFIKHGDFKDGARIPVHWLPYDPVNKTILNINTKLNVRKQKFSNLFFAWDNFQKCIKSEKCMDFM